MAKNVLIVESPSKAKTIKKYLGRDFQVLASVGHIKDLPTKELGIDIEKNFKPRYVTVKGKTKVISSLKNAAKDAEMVYLAPDPDREGEAIAWHIANTISVDESKIKRVLFNEITKKGIEYGIRHPRSIDYSLVNAQQARRILDRIVGYKTSPFLWKTLYSGLSAGRVQSVALRIICEREAEILAFESEEYWNLFADLATEKGEEFRAQAVKYNHKTLKISNREESEKHTLALADATFTVESLTEKNAKSNPTPPFTTSTFQQMATSRYNYPPKKSMFIAQQLYEGVEINGEPVGLITYMRTDSVRISGDAADGIRNALLETYGPDYIPLHPRFFKSDKKNVQDAHECIRPTRFDLSPDKVESFLNKEQFNVYKMIWNKFAASQMTPAEYKNKTLDIAADKYLFRAKGKVLIFDGYLRIWSSKDTSEDPIPAQIAQGDTLQLQKLATEQKFTAPPPRFTDGTLVKELDNLGIGRPSTYATIISTITQRKYVETEAGKLKPTDLGIKVNKILVSGMPDIFNVEFTGKMEAELDEVESNKKDWQEVMQDFYKPFEKSLSKLEGMRKEIKESLQEKTSETCDQCGAPLLIKWSKNGRFYACSRFPDCKFTKPLVNPTNLPVTEKKCPTCGADMNFKEGKFGKFWACSKYPECKTTLPYDIGIGCPMPGCEGMIVEKRTQKGKTFYGCSKYPSCSYATWNKPLPVRCPNCDHPFLERKETKRVGVQIICSNCKSKFSEEDLEENLKE
ncbi:MAG: type I DNA topoisomerase [Candidatus Marinimicrobia bacterium]|nr:type I DNA topoisomerase [Candidatus Neomarinimicrobiota bacterium]